MAQRNGALKKLERFGYRKAGLIALAIVVIGTIAYIGVRDRPASRAATGSATIVLSPASSSYHIGDTVSVAIQVTSPTAISTVEAAFTYPSSLLQFQSVTEGSVFTLTARTSTATAGTIDIIRALNGGSAGVTGTNTVVTVNFKVIAAGSATLGLLSSGNPSSGIYDSSTGSNVYDSVNSKGAAYTLQLPAPNVTSITPASGLSNGGNGVTISGSNFVNGATVKIGGTSATNVTVVNSTTITATAPAHAVGSTAVLVTNPDGQSDTLSNGYVYGNPAPTVTSVSPASGVNTGGTAITITGTGFLSGASVKIGGTSATNVTVSSATTITATTPAHASGAVTVQVTNSDSQTASKTNGFTYTNPAPTISSVSPASGSSGGGTVITISGTNFLSGASVTIGGTAATNVSVTGTTITATAPAHATGTVDVKVTNTDGQSATKTASYSYAALGDINNDGRINALDLSVLLSRDGQNYAPADLNNDGTVGAADLALLLARWTW